MRNIKTGYIIHFFAILHALVAFICAENAFDDQLILTLLTIILTVIVCFCRNADVEFTAASVILVNIVGYLLGTLGADLVSGLINHIALTRSISTLITTEVMGWGIFLFAKYTIKQKDEDKAVPELNANIQGFILVILLLLALRIIYTVIFQSSLYHDISPSEVIAQYFANPIVFLVISCINIIFINQMEHGDFHVRNQSVKVVLSILFIVITTLVSAFLACLGLHLDLTNINPEFYQQMLFIASVIELATFTVIYMIFNVISYRTAMYQERENANLARYRYMMLKQQVDPHFLFNSLNILDCLVVEQKTEQASIYIHKLAGIYRYMLKNEEKLMVELRDELTFANMYIDLLKVRFEDGFRVDMDIPEEVMGKLVVPGTLQLLIENAIKHNVVNEEDPLVIRIVADADQISVSNNLFPKYSDSTKSNKLGLKYIDNQYLNLVGKPIQIYHNEEIHEVIVPLKNGKPHPLT